MGRPAKAIATATGVRPAAEIAERQAAESALRGNSDIVCPDWLTDEQAELFHEIVEHYAEADILSGLDATSLAPFCVAVDRLRDIEIKLNQYPDLLFDSKLMAARKHYESTMWRGCSEFCLSPQARAKIGSLVASKKKESGDPLMDALGDSDE